MSYKELKSYQQAIIIHDFTVEFCKRYISKFSRTVDQMEQAARSGKQNIVEGCSVSKTSPQTELKLIGVARGSLEELLEDYTDFLRQQNLPLWKKEDLQATELRRLPYLTHTTYATYKSYLENPESAANAMMTLINQTNFLLDRQMRGIRKQLEKKGISLESARQRTTRILAANIKREADFDEELRNKFPELYRFQ